MSKDDLTTETQLIQKLYSGDDYFQTLHSKGEAEEIEKLLTGYLTNREKEFTKLKNEFDDEKEIHWKLKNSSSLLLEKYNEQNKKYLELLAESNKYSQSLLQHCDFFKQVLEQIKTPKFIDTENELQLSS